MVTNAARNQAVRQARRGLGIGYTSGFFWFTTALIGYVIVALQGARAPFDAWTYTFPFLVIGGLSLVGLYMACRTQPYSVLATHWTFILFFLCLAPLVQFYWRQFPPQADLGVFGRYHFHAAAVIVAWEIVVLLTYRQPVESEGPRRNVWALLVPKPWMLAAMAVLCFAALIVIMGPMGLLARSQRFANIGGISPALVMTTTLLRSMVFACAALMFINWKGRPMSEKLLSFSLAAMALVANFPTGVARFWIGGILCGVVCLLLTRRQTNGLWLPVVFFASFMVIMPTLGSFRRAAATELLQRDIQLVELKTVPLRGDFDNYIMLVNSTWYLTNNEPTYGVTLVGNLLFFVPTSIWPDKPGNTRDLFIQGTKLEKINGNVANSLLAEGIMNFGWLGILLYAYLFARLMKALDTLYWKPPKTIGHFQKTLVFCYPFLVGFAVYFLRGSFVPALSSTVVFCGGVWLVIFFGARRRKWSIIHEEPELDRPALAAA